MISLGGTVSLAKIPCLLLNYMDLHIFPLFSFSVTLRLCFG